MDLHGTTCLMSHAVALGIVESMLFFSSVVEKERIDYVD